MDQTDKNTFTGREIREYLCRSCGHSDWEDCGTALWQVLHDDAQERAAARQADPEPASRRPEPEKTLWQRLLARLRR
jgi:hypothetical protein